MIGNKKTIICDGEVCGNSITFNPLRSDMTNEVEKDELRKMIHKQFNDAGWKHCNTIFLKLFLCRECSRSWCKEHGINYDTGLKDNKHAH